MCFDYIDLNKPYLKDSYPLFRIDKLVDATSSYKLLIFMDTFLEYNRIMTPPRVISYLGLYLGIIDLVVSSVLVQDDARIQKLIYYINYVLSRPE